MGNCVASAVRLLERRRSRSGSSTRGGELRGGLVAQAAVRPLVVVAPVASVGQVTCGLGQVRELLAVQQLVAQPAVERSRRSRSPTGEPGSMYSVSTPAWLSHDAGSPGR